MLTAAAVCHGTHRSQTTLFVFRLLGNNCVGLKLLRLWPEFVHSRHGDDLGLDPGDLRDKSCRFTNSVTTCNSDDVQNMFGRQKPQFRAVQAFNPSHTRHRRLWHTRNQLCNSKRTYRTLLTESNVPIIICAQPADRVSSRQHHQRIIRSQ